MRFDFFPEQIHQLFPRRSSVSALPCFAPSFLPSSVFRSAVSPPTSSPRLVRPLLMNLSPPPPQSNATRSRSAIAPRPREACTYVWISHVTRLSGKIDAQMSNGATRPRFMRAMAALLRPPPESRAVRAGIGGAGRRLFVRRAKWLAAATSTEMDGWWEGWMDWDSAAAAAEWDRRGRERETERENRR